MNLDDAIYMAVHDYPGGAPALAVRFDPPLTRDTLQKMAAPNVPAHGWSLRRFRQLLAFGDKRPLQALCEENGGVFLPVEAFTDMPEGRLLKAAQKLSREFGDVPRRLEEALRGDGRISKNELSRLEREMDELIAATNALRAITRRLHEQHTRVDEDDRP